MKEETSKIFNGLTSSNKTIKLPKECLWILDKEIEVIEFYANSQIIPKGIVACYHIPNQVYQFSYIDAKHTESYGTQWDKYEFPRCKLQFYLIEMLYENREASSPTGDFKMRLI